MDKYNLILLGPPGAKGNAAPLGGSWASRTCPRNMLRAAVAEDTELGQEARGYMEAAS